MLAAASQQQASGSPAKVGCGLVLVRVCMHEHTLCMHCVLGLTRVLFHALIKHHTVSLSAPRCTAKCTKCVRMCFFFSAHGDLLSPHFVSCPTLCRAARKHNNLQTHTHNADVGLDKWLCLTLILAAEATVKLPKIRELNVSLCFFLFVLV